MRVYVEKPRKKRSSSIQHQHKIDGPISMGCGRRAGLLSYSHLLRQSARGALSAPSFSKWVTNTNLHPPTQVHIHSLLSSSQVYERVHTIFLLIILDLFPIFIYDVSEFIITLQGRFLVLQIAPSNMKKPTCFGSCTWKLLIPRFLRSCSKAKKKENKKKHMGTHFSGNGMRMICCYRS